MVDSPPGFGCSLITQMARPDHRTPVTWSTTETRWPRNPNGIVDVSAPFTFRWNRERARVRRLVSIRIFMSPAFNSGCPSPVRRWRVREQPDECLSSSR